MAKKMLVDTGHPEETRVVVVSGNRIEEFDFESAARKQLKGNIYLAKVTRVEPSLQAAFVEYGGNRHGFLAFSEIHPDYYQIPVADRERLLKQEAEESRRLAEEANEAEENEAGRGRRGSRRGTRRSGRRRRTDGGSAARAAETRSAVDPSDLLAFADRHLTAQAGNRLEGTPDDSTGNGSDSTSPLAFPDLHLAAANGTDMPGDNESDAGIRAIAPKPTASHDSAEPPEDAQSASSAPGDAEAPLRSRSHWVLPDEDGPEADARGGDAAADSDMTGEPEDEIVDPDTSDTDTDETDANGDGDDAETTTINELSADEEAREELERRPRIRLRDYKIQEVIKRRQIMLVQVVKEERGNKGAALTTYLSLAGRYCVLMPNTPRGGGISRKITNAADRKRLKAIAAQLDVPEGMGLIIRTAGANRTKAEIRRDYEYLLRLWESVRELTLQSSAPCLVYEEGSLIKRSIRDLYSREIETVQVEGEEGYKEAKAFMRMLMPSHAKHVQSYKDRIPLFQRYQVEQQLDAMLNPQVQLPSGGYIVLNPTEALVAIDVNSGKSTREHNIEATALRTNLEAAEEVARQLRLRDLAGLIVIDFIDMEEPRNNRAVERKLKDCLKQDRARIQTGRISMFGLLEMSRQRLRAGMMEVSTVTCAHCQGTGLVRSVESAALRILRACEEEGLRQRTQDITVPCAPDVATYLLNIKRHQLTEIEQRYGVTVFIEADLMAGRDSFEIKRGQAMGDGQRQTLNEQAVRLESAFGLDTPLAGQSDEELEAAPKEEETKQPKPRRGGRRRRKAEAEEAQPEAKSVEDQDADKIAQGGPRTRRKAADSEEGGDRRRRRRGKRGGRRHRKSRSGADQPAAEAASADAETADAETAEAHAAEALSEAQQAEEGQHPEPVFAEGPASTSEAQESTAAPAAKRRSRRKKVPSAEAQPSDASNGHAAPRGAGGTTEASGETAATGAVHEPPADDAPMGPSPTDKTTKFASVRNETSKANGHHGDEAVADRQPDETTVEPAELSTDDGTSESPDAATTAKAKRPARRGWWQRRSV